MKNSSKNGTVGNGSASGGGTKRRGSEATPAETSAAAQSPATAALNGKIRAENIQADREAFLNAFESKSSVNCQNSMLRLDGNI